MALFTSVTPTSNERKAHSAGDELVAKADVTMDRAFSLSASPEMVWPWFLQLGKRRAGWYFPRIVERFTPQQRRGLHHIDPAFQKLTVGDIIPDWGGKHANFEAAIINAPNDLVYVSTRGNVRLSWAITLKPQADSATRVHIRLRLAPVRHRWIGKYLGGFFDWLTIVGLAAGLRQRLRKENH